MPKLYLIAPLVALLVFGGIYWHHHRHYVARLAAQRQALELVRAEQRRTETAARDRALAAARVATAERRREREARDIADAARKQARADAATRHTVAAAEERKLHLRLEHLQREVTAVEATVRRSAERHRELQQEQVFLARYVAAAEENRDSVFALLHQLERVESARPPAPQPTLPSTPRVHPRG